jgi:hypothetical protein
VLDKGKFKVSSIHGVLAASLLPARNKPSIGNRWPLNLLLCSLTEIYRQTPVLVKMGQTQHPLNFKTEKRCPAGTSLYGTSLTDLNSGDSSAYFMARQDKAVMTPPMIFASQWNR